MCLSKITQSYEGRGVGPVIAFKKFKIINGKIHNMFQRSETTWEIGKERSAGPKSLKIVNHYKSFSYPAGFHAYAVKRVSWLGSNGVWAIVRLRGVQTKGTQGVGRTVYVARYCKILEILGK